LNVKGFKMDFKVSGSLSKTMSNFNDHLSLVLDMSHVSRTMLDLGGEVCPYSINPTPTDVNTNSNTLVYLWRSCCLNRIHQSLVGDGFKGKQGHVKLYNVGFLRDAACMTIKPPTRCWMHESGFIYGQWYVSAKEIGNAQACYPF